MLMTTILFTSLATLVLLGVPVAFSIGLASLITILATIPDISLTLIAQRCFAGIDTFPLMCIPFFIISGRIYVKREYFD